MIGFNSVKTAHYSWFVRHAVYQEHAGVGQKEMIQDPRAVTLSGGEGELAPDSQRMTYRSIVYIPVMGMFN